MDFVNASAADPKRRAQQRIGIAYPVRPVLRVSYGRRKGRKRPLGDMPQSPNAVVIRAVGGWSVHWARRISLSSVGAERITGRMKPYSAVDIWAGRIITVVALTAAAFQRLDYERDLATKVAIAAIILLLVIIIRRAWSQRSRWHTGW
jgi:hypothetical protein